MSPDHVKESTARDTRHRFGVPPDDLMVVDVALPTDGSDATPALNHAIAANPGRVLRIPCARAHLLTAPDEITSNYTKLTGCGSSLSILEADFSPSPGQPVIQFGPADPRSGARLSGNGISGIGIQRLAYDGAGIGLQLVQTLNFQADDLVLYGHFVGFDQLGTSNTFWNKLVDGNGAYYGSTLEAGSMLGRIRSGYARTQGRRQVSYGTFFTSTSLAAAGGRSRSATVERGLDIEAADGVYLSGANYIGEAKYLLYIVPESRSPGIYLSNILSTGTFLDGNVGESDVGLFLSYRREASGVSAINISFVGGAITGEKIASIVDETNQYAHVIVSGSSIGEGPASWCIQLKGATDFVITGNHLHRCGSGTPATGGINISENVVGPFTVTGNDIQLGRVGSVGVRLGAETGAGSIDGNAFGTIGGLDIVRQGSAPKVEQWGNSTVNAASVPNILRVEIASGLPPCDHNHLGAVAMVNDAASPQYGGRLKGGGSTIAEALCDGSAWLAH